MTEPDPNDRGATHSALNDAEFPDDERGVTATRDDVRGVGATGHEGQTARDVFPEDDGIPEVSQDDSPTTAAAEDPQFAPVPGDRPGASADFGTTAVEQSTGESLAGRLDREAPGDRPDVRPAEDPDRGLGQLEQDYSTTPDTDSGTNRTADDVEASLDPLVGGEGPEVSAIHAVD